MSEVQVQGSSPEESNDPIVHSARGGEAGHSGRAEREEGDLYVSDVDQAIAGAKHHTRRSTPHLADPTRSERTVKRPSRLPPNRQGTQRYLVLSCGPDDLTVIDVPAGVLARLRVGWAEDRLPALAPFDVIDAVPAPDPERDDLAQPEAISVSGLPTKVGTLRGRRVRHMLKELAAPVESNLLGFPGNSSPYWEFRGMRPSVAVVTPRQGPLVFSRKSDESVWVRFGWPHSDNWLPVEDRRVIGALWASRRDRLSGKELTAAVGFRTAYLVVAIGRPVDGHCHKSVTAFLPRP